MCGIFAYLGPGQASRIVLGGLKKLEYRGYDSAGIAVLSHQQLTILKTTGYVSRLAQLVAQKKINSGHLAIGHTRWATHGRVNKANAHPHSDCRREIAIVHNGVIENFALLSRVLTKKGHRFRSATDSEIIAHLIEEELKRQKSFPAAFQHALQQLTGAWAIAAISSLTPNTLWLGRFSSPLALGFSKRAIYASSDARAFPSNVDRVLFLEDGQLAKVWRDQQGKTHWQLSSIKGQSGQPKLISKRKIASLSLNKGNFPHFMLKEIFDQPKAIEAALRGRVDFQKQRVILGGLFSIRRQLQQKRFVGLVACGTSHYAASLGQLFAHGELQLPVWLANSSNYSPLDLVKDIADNSAIFYISQSGETADTLATLQLIKQKTRALNLGIVNVVGSSLARQVEAGVYTRAGPEIGVAASKSFLNQTLALFLSLIYLADLQKHSFPEREIFFHDLRHLPAKIAAVLQQSARIKTIAARFTKVNDFIFLGRHLAYPLAQEGALKLKEISYRFSLATPLGELKHGPLALVSRQNLAVVIIFRHDPHLQRSLANLREITARQGQVLVISDLSAKQLSVNPSQLIPLPHLRSLWLMPFVAAPALQLFAYHLAAALGRPIDKPRHLAKSVTVI